MGSSSGAGIFKGIYNASNVDMAKFNLASEYLTQNSAGTQLYQDVAAKEVYLQINHDAIDIYSYDPNTGIGTVYWDPDRAIEVTDVNKNVVSFESAASNLAHEMAHAVDPNYLAEKKVDLPGYDNLAEKVAIERTNSIVGPLGEAERIAHDGALIIASNPTIHWHDNQWEEVNANGTNESSPEIKDFNNDWDTSTAPSYDPDEPIGDPMYDNGGWNYYGYWSATNASHVDKYLPSDFKSPAVNSSSTAEVAEFATGNSPANGPSEIRPFSLSSNLAATCSSISHAHSLVQAMATFTVSAGAIELGILPTPEHGSDLLYSSSSHRLGIHG